MKIIAGFVVVLLWSGIMFGSGYWYKKRMPDIKIIKETETRFKYIKVAKTSSDYKNCYDSKIDIETEFNELELSIIAKDDCKKAEKKIIFKEQLKHTVLMNYGLVQKDFNVLYNYRISSINLTGGIGYPINIYLGAGYTF